MPTYDTIDALPGYGEAEADYRIALREAGDDVGLQTQAKLDWSEKRFALESQRNAANDEHRAHEAAHAKLKEKYGDDVPESIYASKGTPDEMEAAAKEFHDTLQSRLAAAGHVEGAPPAPSGQPPTGIETAPTLPPAEAGAQRMAELRDKVVQRTATQAEAREFMTLKVGLEIAPAHAESQRVAGTTGGRR